MVSLIKTKKWLRTNSIVGIYRITSPSGKIYIGQSWDIKSRWRLHKSNTKKLGSCPILEKSIQKYGVDNHKFEVIHQLPQDVSMDVLNEYEELYIKLYKDSGIKLLNIALGGRNRIKSAEEIEKVRQRFKIHGHKFKKGHEPWNKGSKGVMAAWNKGLRGVYTTSEETKKKLSIASMGKQTALGRKMNAKTRDALLRANSGRKMPQHVSEILSKYRTTENAKRMGALNIGKVRTLENRQKISKTLKDKTDNKGEFCPKSKLTNDVVLEIRAKYKPCGVYSSLRLSREYGISNTNVKDIINRKLWRHI